MAATSYGSKNQPHFGEGDTPDIAGNPTAVADYAANVGNRKAGLASARTALTGADVWDGLEFFETDTGSTYVYQGGWVFTRQKPVGWANLALASGWVNQGVPPYAPLRSRLDQNGDVRIQGQIVPATGYAATDVFATLPAGQHPPVRLEITVITNSTSSRGIGGVIIDTNGNLSLNPTGIGAFNFGEQIISTI